MVAIRKTKELRPLFKSFLICIIGDNITVNERTTRLSMFIQ